MLTGRAARATTWVTMDEWIEEYSTPDDRPSSPRAGKRTAPKAARKKAAKKAAKKTAKKAASSGAARRKPAPRVPKPAVEVAPDRSAIGSNPDRRFASAPSRNLARKS
jgi:polyhydroxyalkanoate synthase